MFRIQIHHRIQILTVLYEVNPHSSALPPPSPHEKNPSHATKNIRFYLFFHYLSSLGSIPVPLGLAGVQWPAPLHGLFILSLFPCVWLVSSDLPLYMVCPCYPCSPVYGWCLVTCPSTWPAPTIPVLLVLGWCLVTCPSTWPAPAASPNLPWRSSSGTHFPSHAYHHLLIRLTLVAVSYFQSWIEPPECYFSLSSIITSVVLNLMHTYPMNPSIKTSRHVRVGETVLPNKF